MPTSTSPFIVDADSHWSEPPDLFTRRRPPSIKDRVPHVEMVDGERIWVFDGHPMGRASAGGVIGRDGVKEERGHRRCSSGPSRTIHVGAYDPKVRLEVLDECGIDAQVIFPSTIGLGGQDLGMVGPTTLSAASRSRSTTTRMAEIQADSGNRLLPMPLMPAWDVDSCVARGQAGRGARCARREHDVRPARPGRARPRQPRRGIRSGRRARAAAAGALPHRCQRHRHDVLRPVPVGRRTPTTPSWPSAARCCSSATPGSSPT